MTRTLISLATLSLLLPLGSCGDREVHAAAHTIDFDSYPVGLETAKMDKPATFTAAKAELGKHLFFDTRLSSNDAMSCETCHQHDKGWTDGIRFSTKVNGAKNGRNSPTLYNTGYHDLLYWDGRKDSLEGNIGAAWQGHMGGSEEIVAKINGVEGYQTMFQDAFGGPATMENVPEALSHFVRTLRAGDSDYDRQEMSASATAGFELFKGKARCSLCHLPGNSLFMDQLFHNVGAGEKEDIGRGKVVTDDPKMTGAFKTPTLRNVAKTAPYFHDGSVATLEEAVRYMAGGGNANPHLDPLMQKVELTDEEVGQLVDFLKALNSNESFTKPTLPQ